MTTRRFSPVATVTTHSSLLLDIRDSGRARPDEANTLSFPSGDQAG
jgi:hypothetical protein